VYLARGRPTVDVHDYSYAGGPRFNYRQSPMPVFVHALVGARLFDRKRRRVRFILTEQFRDGTRWRRRVEDPAAIALGGPAKRCDDRLCADLCPPPNRNAP